MLEMFNSLPRVAVSQGLIGVKLRLNIIKTQFLIRSFGSAFNARPIYQIQQIKQPQCYLHEAPNLLFGISFDHRAVAKSVCAGPVA